MNRHNRRAFLAEVGRGMAVASLGSALALDLGLAPALAIDDEKRLDFGEMEPLVALMQETPLDKLQAVLHQRISSGTNLKTLVAAGALANARTFGGHDYVGFHTFMALAPALEIARELPVERQPLPVFKVLYRNTQRIQQFGGRKAEILKPVQPVALPAGKAGGELLRDASRRIDYAGAEGILAALANGPVGALFNHVQYPVHDAANVHRIVLAWRAWVAIDLVGEQHAATLLRQSVRYCLREEESRQRNQAWSGYRIRDVLPKLLDEHKLLDRKLGGRAADDGWIAQLAETIFSADPSQAAEAAAQALAEGFSPEDIGQAISVAANMLLLHDPGRQTAAEGDKVIGSVHGDSVGVHASDAANAWRNLARVSDHRNAVANLIIGAYHTAGQCGRVGGEPWPLRHDAAEQLTEPTSLLASAKAAVEQRDQALAGAFIDRYGRLGGEPRDVFDLLLRFSTSEEGALHAEKYYRTVSEEFATLRPAFRWQQLVGLARVAASEFGHPAAGYREACELLKVKT